MRLPTRCRVAILAASSLLPLAACAQEPAPPAAAHPTPAPFAGAFKGDGLSLELAFSDGRYRGTLRIASTEYPVDATPDGDTLKGTFNADGTSFEFTARLEPDALVLTSAGNSHRLARPRRENPLANPLATPAATEKNPLAATPAAPEGTTPSAAAPDPDLPQRIEHIVGVTVSLPRDWAAQQANGNLVMVPPDAPRDESGPNELYMLVFATSPSPSADHDAAIIEKLSTELGSLNATLQSTGAPEKFSSPMGPATRIGFSGTTDQGARIQIAAEFAVRDGVAIGILTIGESRAVSGRRETIRKVFNALRPAAPRRDEHIAGNWSKSSGYSDSNSGFSMATEVKLRLDLAGRYARSSRAIGGDMSNSVDSQGDTTRGRWFAADNVFILLSDEGDTTQGAYKLIDGNLVVTPAGGKRQIWSR